MRTKSIFILMLIGMALIVLAACGAPGTVPAAEQPPAPAEAPAEEPAAAAPTEAAPEEPAGPPDVAAITETGISAVCPQAGEETQLVVNLGAGYCFLIPAGYTTGEPVPGQITVFAPEETEGHRERAFVNVEAAFGRTAASIAGAQEADMAGFPITRTTVLLDGTEAVVLDNLPGQDLNRKLFAVSGDRLVQMMFMPIDPQAGEAQAQAEAVYDLLFESFRFIPAEQASSTSCTAISDAAAACVEAVELPLLTWEGEIQGACHTLRILNTGEATVGLCGDAPQTVDFPTNPESEWAAIQAHFAALDAETEVGHVAVQGQGEATGPAWAQALATWARFTAMELSSGRTSASVRTVLAWNLGPTADQQGICSQLLMLAYGLAYANQIPCEGGGQAQTVVQSWLETEELETLQTWLDTKTRVDDAAGYLAAEGNEPLTAEEVTAWAEEVYAWITQ